jgi:membrane fusion protein, multidrug efflux system
MTLLSRHYLLLAAAALASALAAPALGAGHVVAIRHIDDRKAVFATVESVDIVQARTRIGGTVEGLTVDEGGEVAQDELIATVQDPRIELQIAATDARTRSLEAQLAQAGIDLERARELHARATIPQARLDEAQTNLDVVEGQLAAMRAEREVLAEQIAQGAVRAPAAGRVLDVQVVNGSIVMAGETIATIASERYVLRLELPERHARFMAVGDPVDVGARGLAGGLYEDEETFSRGRIVKVYPQLSNGRVIAEAEVGGLGDFFVGERVRVHVSTGTRPAIVVPPEFLFQRFGLHYVRLADGTDVVVQPGQRLPEGVEILSGLEADDELVLP